MGRIFETRKSTIAQNARTLPDSEATEVLKMIDAFEQDDDVQRVFHGLA